MEAAATLVKIKRGTEVADLKIYPADFQFADFDRWLRARFLIAADANIIYRDREGNECFPTKSFFGRNTELIVDTTDAPKAKPSTSKQMDKSKVINQHIPIAIAVIAMLVYTFQHAELVPSLASIEANLLTSGYYLKKEIILEAMINGLGWAIMHLFVRRMLNPENEGKWFDGYFLDSCYGGLAAFGQTMFKGFFLVTILKKSGAV